MWCRKVVFLSVSVREKTSAFIRRFCFPTTFHGVFALSFHSVFTTRLFWVHRVVLLKKSRFFNKNWRASLTSKYFLFYIFLKEQFSKLLVRFKLIFKENWLKYSVNSKSKHKNSVRTPCNNSDLLCGKIGTAHLFSRI